MEPVQLWTGRSACALQAALRMTNESFAAHLGTAGAHASRVVLASTCVVYGEQTEQPISETTPVAPSSPYGRSKLAADQAAADLAAITPCARARLAAGAPTTSAAANPSTVHDVITTAEIVTGRPVPRRHTTAAHEPATLLADNTRIRTELGWRPERSTLPEIITDTRSALTRE
jgi:UDP-glucose 4-epimerase